MDGEHAEVVAAYWQHHALAKGDGAERLAAADVFWAWETVSDLVADGELPVVIAVLDELLAAP